MNKIKKMYSMNEHQVNFIKEQADKLQIAESDYLRRLIDKHIEDNILIQHSQDKKD